MRKSESGKSVNLIELIRTIEHELAGWEYYQAINGKSAIATLFFLFLKYYSDTCLDKGSEGIIDVMKARIENNDVISGSYVFDYIFRIIAQWGDSGDVLQQYVKRIEFEKLPSNFIGVLEKIAVLDFRNKDMCDELTFAISALYMSLYGEAGLNEKISIGEIYTLIVAGDLLECQEGMSVYDFSCRTGGLLAFGASDNCTIYAQEIDFDKSIIAYMILKILEVQDVYMEVSDVLESPITLKYEDFYFDRIISAPPVRNKYTLSTLLKNKYDKEFQYDNPLEESEFWVYARYMVKKMKKNGKAVLVAPISVLSKEGNTKTDRKKFILDGYIQKIIQLPTDMASDTNKTKICLIIMSKPESKAEHSTVYMADFSGEKGRQVIYAENDTIHIDYNKISNIVNNREIIRNVTIEAGFDLIFENNLNLTPAIYLRNITEMLEQEIAVTNIIEKQRDLVELYHESEEKLNRALLNYYEYKSKKIH